MVIFIILGLFVFIHLSRMISYRIIKNRIPGEQDRGLNICCGKTGGGGSAGCHCHILFRKDRVKRSGDRNQSFFPEFTRRVAAFIFCTWSERVISRPLSVFTTTTSSSPITTTGFSCVVKTSD